MSQEHTGSQSNNGGSVGQFIMGGGEDDTLATPTNNQVCDLRRALLLEEMLLGSHAPIPYAPTPLPISSGRALSLVNVCFKINALSSL